MIGGERGESRSGCHRLGRAYIALRAPTECRCMEKVTYASLGTLGDDFHQSFDDALGRLRGRLGLPYPLYIGGKPRKAREGVFRDHCPADTRIVLGQFQLGDRTDAQKAINAARDAFPSWRDTPWPDRVKLLRNA